MNDSSTQTVIAAVGSVATVGAVTSIAAVGAVAELESAFDGEDVVAVVGRVRNVRHVLGFGQQRFQRVSGRRRVVERVQVPAIAIHGTQTVRCSI